MSRYVIPAVLGMVILGSSAAADARSRKAGADAATPTEAAHVAPPVLLTEVDSRVEPSATRLTDPAEALRREALVQLAAVDWAKAGVRGRYTLSAALVRLDSSREADGLHVSCTVSAMLRDAKRGTLLALVEGRARAEEAPAAAAAAERGALAGAVQGAIAALPNAIRRLE